MNESTLFTAGDYITVNILENRLSQKLPILIPKKLPIKVSKSCYFIFKVAEKLLFFITCLHLKLVLLRIRSCTV